MGAAMPDIISTIGPHRLTPDHGCVGISAVHLRTAADTITDLRKALKAAMEWNWLEENQPPSEVVKMCEDAMKKGTGDEG